MKRFRHRRVGKRHGGKVRTIKVGAHRVTIEIHGPGRSHAVSVLHPKRERRRKRSRRGRDARGRFR